MQYMAITVAVTTALLQAATHCLVAVIDHCNTCEGVYYGFQQAAKSLPLATAIAEAQWSDICIQMLL
jgi:hypothetical protein